MSRVKCLINVLSYVLEAVRECFLFIAYFCEKIQLNAIQVSDIKKKSVINFKQSALKSFLHSISLGRVLNSVRG